MSKQTSTPGSSSKLPKFLQRQNHSTGSSCESSFEPGGLSTPFRKGSKFLGGRRETSEPVAIPQARQSTIQVQRSAPDHSSTTRIGDLPTRLSGWFSHTFTSSTTDLSLPAILSQSSSASPKSKASALLTVAKHGKGHLDKAMRYLLDSDATPDKSTEPIWLLGVQHIGYEPPSPISFSPTAPARVESLRSSTSSVASNAEISLALSSSSASANSNPHYPQQPPSPVPSSAKNNPAANWPPVFYIDFVSRIWLTYRSHFPQPIKDSHLSDLCAQFAAGAIAEQVTSPSHKSARWHWGGEKTWSSDTGWGCMLRTGQSLLANALIHAHLGRDWRRPPYPIHTSDYATYVQILTWFFDTPSPDAPFSVHRMALAGKELGTDVGQWFGPSVAAGALKRLVNEFPQAGIGVSVAKDGVLSQTDVFRASHSQSDDQHQYPHHHQRGQPRKAAVGGGWGDRPVLVLIGLRLGIDGVNPIYYETIKTLFTFPQSIGIAGGRPSSSYYFVGCQGDMLVYLDPHNARPAIPLRPPPSSSSWAGGGGVLDISPANMMGGEEGGGLERRHSKRDRKERVVASYHGHPTSSSGVGHGRSPTFPASPLQRAVSSDSGDQISSYSDSGSGGFGGSVDKEGDFEKQEEGGLIEKRERTTTSHKQQHKSHKRIPIPGPISVVLSQSSTNSASTSSSIGPASTTSTGGGGSAQQPTISSSNSASASGLLDPMQEHFVTSYAASELKTYHCERVRKMPLNGLDPSMLLGFLCRSEEEWEGLRKRVEDLPKSIFSIQNEHPTWAQEDYDDDDSDMMGLESMSEPDIDDGDEGEEGEEDEDILKLDEEEDDDDDLGMDLRDGKNQQQRKKRRRKVIARDDDDDDDDEEEEEGDEEEDEYYLPSGSVSRSTSASGGESSSHGTGATEEVDTEEDPVEALTPGPNSKFDLSSVPRDNNSRRNLTTKGKRRETSGTVKPQPQQQEDGESDIEDGWVDSVVGFDDDDDDVEDVEDVSVDVDVEEEQGVVTPLAGSTIAVVQLPLPPSSPPRTPKSPVIIDPTTPSKSKSKSRSKPSTPRMTTTTTSTSQPKASSSSSSMTLRTTSSSASSKHTKAKSDSETKTKKKRKDKNKAVPVPQLLPVSSEQKLKQHQRRRLETTTTTTGVASSYFPFPGSGPDGDFDDADVGDVFDRPTAAVAGGGGGGVGVGPGTRSWERGRYESQSWAGPGVSSSSTGGGGTSTTSTGGGGVAMGLRMFKGKGRDGGRTQSGGVKGILTDGS